MRVPDFLRPAVMAAVSILSEGRRILVSSRSFWKSFGFPLPDVRRDIVRAARAILAASDEAERGSTSGTVADLFSQRDFPTTDIGGGTMGLGEATAYARFRFEDEEGNIQWRSWSRQVPWDMTMDALQNFMDSEILRLGSMYGLGTGVVEPDSMLVY